MLKMSNYLTKDESFKDIILHPNYDIMTIIKNIKRNDAFLIKWANDHHITITKGFINDTLTGNYL